MAPVSAARGFLQVARPDEEAELGALIEAVARGEPRAISRFFGRYQATVNRLVWRLLGADAAHDDVVSVAFETMVRRIRDVRSPGALEGWVRAVTVNATRMELRGRRWRRLFSRSIDEGVGLDHPDLSVPDEEQRERLRVLYRALGRLGADERQMLVLRHLEGLELTEVAEAMGCSLATLKRRLVRGEERLATALGAQR
jgi:RNA polymerase sigma-70 factor (ECF subfamily)